MAKPAAYAGRAVPSVGTQVLQRPSVLLAQGCARLHVGRSAFVGVVATPAVQTADGSVTFSVSFATAEVSFYGVAVPVVVVDPRPLPRPPNDEAADKVSLFLVTALAVEDARVAVEAVTDAAGVAVCLPGRIGGGLPAVVAFAA